MKSYDKYFSFLLLFILLLVKKDENLSYKIKKFNYDSFYCYCILVKLSKVVVGFFLKN